MKVFTKLSNEIGQSPTFALPILGEKHSGKGRASAAGRQRRSLSPSPPPPPSLDDDPANSNLLSLLYIACLAPSPLLPPEIFAELSPRPFLLRSSPDLPRNNGGNEARFLSSGVGWGEGGRAVRIRVHDSVFALPTYGKLCKKGLFLMGEICKGIEGSGEGRSSLIGRLRGWVGCMGGLEPPPTEQGGEGGRDQRITRPFSRKD